ncbi:helix-turn-helix transcriptional regulator [Bradyrhizobium sp. SZCCHNR1015]|uniref:helix-turn-helix domain-containing protein n=1 Tax=Bradyrhizobium sp. SZCCHNR1015 TaxID=3057338 RepID=UPI0029166DA0|nr:helix-turn-helix transcriptional regulator [Bradyrhizobium sp. SZCCHNR1015]
MIAGVRQTGSVARSKATAARAQACPSPDHFCRLFREATGLSAHRYVTDRRVQAARHELARSRVSLVEIALEFGFGSQANVTRLFCKAADLTPGQYLELCSDQIQANADGPDSNDRRDCS